MSRIYVVLFIQLHGREDHKTPIVYEYTTLAHCDNIYSLMS